MEILCIETSCDETAAAVVRGGMTIRSSVVSSQVSRHAEYGGVVPEIASRLHLEYLPRVIHEALGMAETDISAIEGIAVTRGPGLLGALLVGVSTAKAIAAARRIPIAGIHHIEGHIFSAFFERTPRFPFIALVVSGGHSHLYRIDGFGRYATIGRTRDDAAGEAFDKVASLLGISYPGGAEIDRLSLTGNPDAIKFPRPLARDPECNFSFSGLKTAVLTKLRTMGEKPEGALLADICASFQEAVCDTLCSKTFRALHEQNIDQLVVAGGVACNSRLRKKIADMAERYSIELVIPPPPLCGDNAAMLGVAGEWYLNSGFHSPPEMDAVATWDMDRIQERFL